MVYKNLKTGAEIMSDSIIQAPNWVPVESVKKEPPKQEPAKLTEPVKETVETKEPETVKEPEPVKEAPKKRSASKKKGAKK